MTKIRLAFFLWVCLPNLGLAKTSMSVSPARARIAQLADQIARDLPPEVRLGLVERLTLDARQIPSLSLGLDGWPTHGELGREMFYRGSLVGKELANLWLRPDTGPKDVTYLLQQILIAQLIEALGQVSRAEQHDLAVRQSFGVGAVAYLFFQQLNPDLVLAVLHRADIPHVSVMTAGFLAALGLPYATSIGNGVSANFQTREAKLILYSEGLAHLQDSVYRVFRQHAFWRALVKTALETTPPAQRETADRFVREWLGIGRLNSFYISAAIYRHRPELVARLVQTLKLFRLSDDHACAASLAAGIFNR